MLSRDGDGMLVDFGIAVTRGEGDRDAAQSAPTGSFPYLPPEQVRREPLSGQTDLFSVGVLCWEMLAGRRLFARNDPDATLEAVLSGDIPRPSALRPEVPAKLDEVVMRALARAQAARWPRAGDMLAALNRFLYALEEIPGPREVAALFAKFCPPETRRMPTHLESMTETTDEDSAPVAASGPATEVTPKGPATAVIPKDAQVKGKKQRAQTFATNVQLEDLLSRATPLFPIDAIKGEPAASDAPGERAPERAEKRRGMVAPPLPVPGRNPPSRAALVVVGLGGLGLAAGALYVFNQGRSSVLGQDAAADAPADARAIDAPRDAAADVAPPEAPPAAPNDAAVPRPDAAVRMMLAAALAAAPRDAAAADAAGSATLKVGAAPSGTIEIDGKTYGQTPRTITVTAGETKPIQADFH